MCVSEILDVFCEVAEEENVLLANFASDFDLRRFSRRFLEM